MDDAPPALDFTPVGLQRKRRDGWTPARQRAFIAALARCGSVAAAAREVGMSPRSAYALLDRPGAESFADAWDAAVVTGKEALLGGVIDRALKGAYVPVIRRGRLVRMEFRYFDALAGAVLSGRNRDFYEEQRARRHWRDAVRAGKEQDRLKAERERAEQEALAAFHREHERAWQEIKEKEAAARRAAGPRVYFL